MPEFRISLDRGTRLGLSATLALCLLSACTSADTHAGDKAAEAQVALGQNRIADASVAIRKALAARDDVADYWLLKAHIDIRANDRVSTFSDYEYVVQLDHGNIEALRALCQLGTSAGPPGKVDSYADQLLVLAPDAAAALTAKGNVALLGGDTDKAQALADRVLARDPHDAAALALKARVLIIRGKLADAAALIETLSGSSVDAVPRLEMLRQIYARAHDRPSYVLTLRRLAQSAPADAGIQLDYADMLYQDGETGPARAAIRKVMAGNPSHLVIAAEALNVWMKAGARAIDTGRMAADTDRLSILMKADYAQFANEINRPDIAIAILRGVDRTDLAPDNANAKAAFAYAIGVDGHRADGLAQLGAILDADPNQPWALLARARLLGAAHDYRNAIRDARLLVANDRDNATAHLALADIMKASGSPDLSESALREGIRAIPGSTRLAARLAEVLAARGQAEQAA